MKYYLDSKAIVLGFTIALITGILSLSLAPIFYPENASSADFVTWDLQSPENLVLSMEQSLPNLIYVSISTGIVSTTFIENVQSWSVTSYPFFIARIASFQYSPILDDSLNGVPIKLDDIVFKNSYWKLNYLDCCPFEKKSTKLTNTKDFQEQLQNGLISDITRFADLTNITFTLDEQVKIAEMQEDVFYWEIIQIYNDGTLIEIRVYGNVVIISQVPILEILILKQGLFPSIPQ